MNWTRGLGAPFERIFDNFWQIFRLFLSNGQRPVIDLIPTLGLFQICLRRTTNCLMLWLPQKNLHLCFVENLLLLIHDMPSVNLNSITLRHVDELIRVLQPISFDDFVQKLKDPRRSLQNYGLTDFDFSQTPPYLETNVDDVSQSQFKTEIKLMSFPPFRFNQKTKNESISFIYTATVTLNLFSSVSFFCCFSLFTTFLI